MTDEKRTLPARFYADPDQFALELERFFGTMWVAVGRSHDPAGPVTTCSAKSPGRVSSSCGSAKARSELFTTCAGIAVPNSVPKRRAGSLIAFSVPIMPGPTICGGNSSPRRTWMACGLHAR